MSVIEGEVSDVQHDEAEPRRGTQGPRDAHTSDLMRSGRRCRKGRRLYRYKERVAAVIKEFAKRRRRLRPSGMLAIDIVYDCHQILLMSRTESLIDKDADRRRNKHPRRHSAASE